MLKVEGIETWYGAIQALKGISLGVNQGEIVTLLGANGAGKSTTIKTITGLLKPAKGRIEFLGKDITGMEAEDIAEIGIACVPEGRRIFPGLTVTDNLMLGATPRKRASKDEIQKDLARVFGIFPQLERFKGSLGWQLSGGQLQMLAIGRGLMANSKILLLDEPSLGLAPVVVQEVFKVIKEINRMGTTILLVEQNARMALLIANRGFVLETGKVMLADTAANLLANEEMKAHYLGAHAHVKEDRERRRVRPQAKPA
ncbi:MAG TPA: ABC transporter ATP-binding protein [Thermodesulfobacteriota bacterium]|nr:ABC transporter ATP-binding protein [Thermodesulfobacteriota bacterium]